MIRDLFPLHKIQTLQYECRDVSEHAMVQIMERIRIDTGHRFEINSIVGTAWDDPDNKYPGTLPKRLSSWLYKNTSYKMAPSTAKAIGDIAMQSMVTNGTYWFDFDDKLNWSAGDFGDKNACFFTGQNAGALPLLRAYHALAVRFYTSKDGKGIARAWMLFPDETDKFTPAALAKHSDDMVLICNAYGAGMGLNIERIATILAKWTGLDFVRAKAEVHEPGTDSHPSFYMNGEEGSSNKFLLGPLAKIKQVELLDFQYSDYRGHFCAMCKKEGKPFHVERGEGVAPAKEYCKRCFNSKFDSCQICGDRHPTTEMSKVGRLICCAKCKKNSFICPICAQESPLKRHREIYMDGQAVRVCRDHAVYTCMECYKYILCEHPCKHYTKYKEEIRLAVETLAEIIRMDEIEAKRREAERGVQQVDGMIFAREVELLFAPGVVARQQDPLRQINVGDIMQAAEEVQPNGG